jgi:hypothetical protein
VNEQHYLLMGKGYFGKHNLFSYLWPFHWLNHLSTLVLIFKLAGNTFSWRCTSCYGKWFALD